MSDIAKIDKNFEVKEDLKDNNNLDLYAIPNDKTALYGAVFSFPSTTFENDKSFTKPLDKRVKVCYNTPHHRNAMKELFFACPAFRESAVGASR